MGLGVLVGFDAVRAALRPGTAPRRHADAPPNPYDPDFRVGDTAPDFTLPDRFGKKHGLSSLVRGDTLLFTTCGCAHCMDLQNYLGLLSHHMEGRAPAVINVTTMPRESEDAWLRNTGLPQTILYERKKGPVVAMYRGHPCPRVFRLDKGLKVTWIGPSMPEAGALDVMGDAMAANLGFSRAEARALVPMK